jgi:hypothetical protein
VDFDFFTQKPFEPYSLVSALPYLKDAVIRQSAPNTLTATVDRGAPVQLSFFGDLDLGQAAEEDIVDGPRLKVASLLDLAGTKAAVVTQRAEVRDYLDIHALLTKAEITLPKMLAAAAAIYGTQFNPLVSLKAMSYHDDSALAELPLHVRHDLVEAVRAVDLQQLPKLVPVRPRSAP